jgi:hypothetical protein
MWAFAPSSTSYTPTRARPPGEPVAESAPANPHPPIGLAEPARSVGGRVRAAAADSSVPIIVLG